MDSELATGVSRPLGVRLLEDSTTPQMEWGKLTKGDDSKEISKRGTRDRGTIGAFFVDKENKVTFICNEVKVFEEKVKERGREKRNLH